MAVGARSDPYLAYRFLVEIEALVVGGFSGVSGMGVRMEPEEYAEGGVNTHTHSLPTRYTHSNVTLTRGLTDADGLWRWVEQAVEGRVRTRHVSVYVLDATGARAWGWQLLDAYPVGWTGPELQADGSSVAVETLELAHGGIRRIEGASAG
jgi:phage tail-like protein